MRMMKLTESPSFVHAVWQRDCLVEIAFERTIEVRQNACDENVEIYSFTSSSVIVQVKKTAAAAVDGPVGRFGCSFNGLGTDKAPRAEHELFLTPAEAEHRAHAVVQAAEDHHSSHVAPCPGHARPPLARCGAALHEQGKAWRDEAADADPRDCPCHEERCVGARRTHVARSVARRWYGFEYWTHLRSTPPAAAPSCRGRSTR